MWEESPQHSNTGEMLQYVTKYLQKWLLCCKVRIEVVIPRSQTIMALSDTQVLVALVIALLPGILAYRLATELYK